MGLVGFGEVRLAMKDVCGGGGRMMQGLLLLTTYLTMARPRPLLTLAQAGGVWLLVVTRGSATVSCID